MPHSKCAFSLVELIIAIAVTGGLLAAVLGLLAGLLREAKQVDDHHVALQLVGVIESRLYEEMGGLFPGGLQTGRIFVADKDGTWLRPEADTDPLLRPAYFYIVTSVFSQPPLAYQSGQGVLPLRVRVSWPYEAVLAASAAAGSPDQTQSVEFVVSLTPP